MLPDTSATRTNRSPVPSIDAVRGRTMTKSVSTLVRSTGGFLTIDQLKFKSKEPHPHHLKTYAPPAKSGLDMMTDMTLFRPHMALCLLGASDRCISS